MIDIYDILNIGVDVGASDVHLSSGNRPMMRIDGEMRAVNINGVEMPIITDDALRLAIFKVISDQDRVYFDEKKDIDLALSTEGSRFRVNVFNNSNGISAVFRVIPSEVISYEQLNLPKICVDVMSKKNGLVLVTGPTGSGKSTTLAAMVDFYNKNYSGHVITIEDPIEFLHQSDKSLINQREVGRDTLSFNNALRASLREDPDVIMVGELRDLESIRLALTAAETGHLVLGTLHSSSAAQTISRLIDVFPEGEKEIIRLMLAGSLRLVVSQHLLRKKKGGRIAAFEIMTGNTAVKNSIRSKKEASINNLIHSGASEGMQLITKDIDMLIDKGIINESYRGVFSSIMTG